MTLPPSEHLPFLPVASLGLKTTQFTCGYRTVIKSLHFASRLLLKSEILRKCTRHVHREFFFSLEFPFAFSSLLTVNTSSSSYVFKIFIHERILLSPCPLTFPWRQSPGLPTFHCIRTVAQDAQGGSTSWDLSSDVTPPPRPQYACDPSVPLDSFVSLENILKGTEKSVQTHFQRC